MINLFVTAEDKNTLGAWWKKLGFIHTKEHNVNWRQKEQEIFLQTDTGSSLGYIMRQINQSIEEYAQYSPFLKE